MTTFPEFTALLCSTMLLVACWAVGDALLHFRRGRDELLAGLAMRTGWGLLFWTGVAATAVNGRICYGTWVPLLQGLVAAVGGRLMSDGQEPMREKMGLRQVVVIALGWLGTYALIFALFDWEMPGGGVRSLHSDLGYWAQLCRAVPEAGVSNGWAQVLGPELTAQHVKDDWYHWGPIWLAGALGMMTALPPLVLLLKVTAAVMAFTMILLSAAMVRLLARTGPATSLLAGAAALIGVQWIKMFGVLWLEAWLPYGTLQHSRLSVLAYHGYYAEGVLLLMIVTAWQLRLTLLAGVLVYLAGLSAPHNVAVLGTAAGTLMVGGAMLRRRHLWQPAGTAVVVLLLAWGTLKFGLGVDQSMAEGQSLFQPDAWILWKRFSDGCVDATLGFILELLLLPGLICLVRQEKDTQEGLLRSALGWLALSAIAGSYIGYHLLRHVSNVFHFTVLAHAVLVVPASIWGLLLAWRQGTVRWRRWGCVALVVLSTMMGLHDLAQAKKRGKAMPFEREEMEAVRKALAGRTVGYFATTDRQWWISKHGTLGAWLEARCLRLNRIEAVESDSFSQFYGGSVVEKAVPRMAEEDDLTWSLRLLRAVGGKHVLETSQDVIPAALKNKLRLICDGETLRLYEMVK